MFHPKLDTTKFAIVYPRQSTGDQVLNNVYSLERQMQLKDQALRDGFPEDAVMVVDDDLGVSGRSIERRQGFSRALRLMEQKVVAAIYVEDLTRLSRDERTIDQMIIADACERSGTLIYMGRSWYDMRDSGQRQSYKYQAVGGSEYWKAHVQKLHETRKEKARQGKAVTQIPRGYRVNKEGKKGDPDRDKLIVHEPEAAVIRALVARLPEAGSFQALFRETYPTYWPNGDVLSRTHLKKILGHPIYRGIYVWGDIEIPGAHEAIISPDEAAMIDRLMALNKATKRGHNPRAGGLLSGLIYCTSCARRMDSNSANHSPAYRCQVRWHPGERRYHFQLHAGVVDDLAMHALWGRLNEGLIANLIEVLERQRAAMLEASDMGAANRAALERKIAGLTRSLSDPDASALACRILLQQLDQTARELEALDNQRPVSKHIEADIEFYRKLRADRAFLLTLPLTWADEPLQWRRSWVRHFFDRVEIEDQGQGNYGIRVHFLDGEVSTVSHYHAPDWSPEELALFRRLWLDHERPQKRGWSQWIQDRMLEQGYYRTRKAIYTKSHQEFPIKA